ncbi:MAG: acetyl-CoA carboxylase biotin carboxyl carrier protein [Myxococcota bacterium]
MDIDLNQLRELLTAFREFDLSELEIENGDERIMLRRGAGEVIASAPMALSHHATIPPPAPEAAPAPAESEDDPSIAFVTSPFVGTFYRSPGPDAAPFVEKGDQIKPGQTLCIVEAMKLMNEIESELAGTLVEILV